MKKAISLALVLACLLALAFPAMAAKEPDLKTLVDGTAEYMLSVVKEPGPADIGGDWAVLGLARSGVGVPEGYFEGDYSKVVSYVK